MPSYLANLLFYILGPLAVIAVVALVLTVILEGP